MAFGHVLRQRRIQNGQTQLDLEVISKVARSYISELEAGKRQVCLRSFMQLAFSLEMTPSQLMDEVIAQMDPKLVQKMREGW